MKRWLGVAGLGGLTVLSVMASPDAASAAPKADSPPGASANNRAPAKPAAAPARSAAKGPAASQANPNPGKGNPNPGKGNPGKANANPGRGNPNPGKGNPNPGKGKGNPNPGKGNPNPGKGKGNPNPGKGNPNPGKVAAAEAAPTTAPLAAAAVPAATPVGGGQAQVQVTICHATSSETTPFELITIASPAGQAHLAHGDVAPVNGVCPGAITPPAPGEPVTICHRTNSDTNPFEIITIPDSALPAHLAHGDIATVGGVCSGPVVLPQVIVRPGNQGGRVLGTQRSAELDTVRARSFSEAVPVARAERVSRRDASGERRGTLPATGTDTGSLVLLGLLLLLAGARLTRHGKVRTAMASQPMSRPGAGIAGSPAGRPSQWAKAPPTLLRRRE